MARCHSTDNVLIRRTTELEALHPSPDWYDRTTPGGTFIHCFSILSQDARVDDATVALLLGLTSSEYVHTVVFAVTGGAFIRVCVFLLFDP
jgi:hypothetical protein